MQIAKAQPHCLANIRGLPNECPGACYGSRLRDAARVVSSRAGFLAVPFALSRLPDPNAVFSEKAKTIPAADGALGKSPSLWAAPISGLLHIFIWIYTEVNVIICCPPCSGARIRRFDA